MFVSMGTPQLNADQVNQLSDLVADYINNQRASFNPNSQPLTAMQRNAMAGFFSAEVLDTARLVRLIDRRVTNPPFYPKLLAMGFRNLPDFSFMAAITFCDVVVSHEAFADRLLFHELVHVEQYRQLGVPEFSNLYVRGFLSGGGYEDIPLEVNAYTLDARFHNAPAAQFPVADEVRSWITEGRF